jgi:hypothetical protein
MATTYKVLGQVAPGAATDTTLYTVPSATSTVVSSIIIANRLPAQDSFSIAVRPAGVTLADEHYIAYQIPIALSDSLSLTLGLTLASTDVVTIWCANGGLTFNLYGSELT